MRNKCKTMKYSDIGELLPNIKQKPPGPQSITLAETLKKYEGLSGCPTLRDQKIPVTWKYAKGSNVVDVDDNIFLDLSAGFGVAAIGYSHPRIIEAIKDQADELTHAPPKTNPHPLRVKLVEKLAEITPDPLQKSILTESGSLAVETAMKAAKTYKKTYGFISFHGGFHGNNMQGALSLTAYKYKNIYQPLLPGIVFVPYPYCYRCVFGKDYPDCDMQCTKYLEYILANPATGIGNIAAVVVEPIQGVGGWIVPPKEFLRDVRKICNDHNILLILDEIYTGFARTGKLFCFQHSGIVPDIITVGKGISSSLPMAATIGKGDVIDTIDPNTSTFFANPLSCACAVTSIDVIFKDKLVERAEKIGAYFLKSLRDGTENCNIVGDVRGKGLLVGVELVKDKNSKDPAVEEAEKAVLSGLQKGLIFHSGGMLGNFLRLSPPLVITEEQVDYAVETLCAVLKEMEPN
jgi:4-aminobutyrate aminotransferase